MVGTSLGPEEEKEEGAGIDQNHSHDCVKSSIWELTFITLSSRNDGPSHPTWKNGCKA